MSRIPSIVAALTLLGLCTAGPSANAAPAGDVQAGKALAESECMACHGVDKTANAETPILAGQTWRYLYLQMRDFQAGRRSDPVMTPLMKDRDKQEMYDLAAYYSEQSFKGENETGDPSLVAQGRKIADDALCTMCHLGGLKGQNEVPRVAGQHYSYIMRQLLAFKNEERTNDAGTMRAYMSNVSEAQMEAVSSYVATLGN